MHYSLYVLMDKRGDGEDFLMRNLIYIVVVIAFFVIMYGFLVSHDGDARKWEEFYAKELSLAVDTSNAGTEFAIDVTPLTKIAFKKGVSKDEAIIFDNGRNEVIVKATNKGATTFRFFNELNVEGVHLELAAGGENLTSNILYFRVVNGGETE